MAIGRSSSVYSAYSSVRSMPRTSPSELTISVTTRPHPPWRLTRRRNAVSVMPAIGAIANGVGSLTGPIRMSVRLHVRRVNFDADRLADQVHRQDKPRLRRILPHQPPDDALERTVRDFDHHALVNHRAGIELQLAANQQPDALQFVFGDRRRPALEGHDVHHDGALENRQRVFGIELGEAVAGEERPVDLLLAILPAAPPRDGRQKRFNPLLIQLLPHDLLVTRAGPDGEPLRVRLDHYCGGAAATFACWARPSSYAFFTS